MATVEEYDPATNTWTTKAPMPTARESLGLAAASNGKIYAVGGAVMSIHGVHFEGHPLATVEEYTP
jgi:hypothetical protein